MHRVGLDIVAGRSVVQHGQRFPHDTAHRIGEGIGLGAQKARAIQGIRGEKKLRPAGKERGAPFIAQFGDVHKQTLLAI